jgi:steroid delta-isomerase-like uncharacterized protein
MSTEANKAIVRRYLEEVWNEGRRDLFEEFITDDVVHHPDLGAPGLKPIKAFYDMAMNGLADYHMAIEEEIAEGDKVVLRWKWTAKHVGDLMGIPATSKEVGQTGITIFRLADGKIVWIWQEDDSLGLLQQLGVVPPLGPEGG